MCVIDSSFMSKIRFVVFYNGQKAELMYSSIPCYQVLHDNISQILNYSNSSVDFSIVKSNKSSIKITNDVILRNAVGDFLLITVRVNRITPYSAKHMIQSNRSSPMTINLSNNSSPDRSTAHTIANFESLILESSITSSLNKEIETKSSPHLIKVQPIIPVQIRPVNSDKGNTSRKNLHDSMPNTVPNTELSDSSTIDAIVIIPDKSSIYSQFSGVTDKQTPTCLLILSSMSPNGNNKFSVYHLDEKGEFDGESLESLYLTSVCLKPVNMSPAPIIKLLYIDRVHELYAFDATGTMYIMDCSDFTIHSPLISEQPVLFIIDKEGINRLELSLDAFYCNRTNLLFIHILKSHYSFILLWNILNKKVQLIYKVTQRLLSSLSTILASIHHKFQVELSRFDNFDQFTLVTINKDNIISYWKLPFDQTETKFLSGLYEDTEVLVPIYMIDNSNHHKGIPTSISTCYLYDKSNNINLICIGYESGHVLVHNNDDMSAFVYQVNQYPLKFIYARLASINCMEVQAVTDNGELSILDLTSLKMYTGKVYGIKHLKDLVQVPSYFNKISRFIALADSNSIVEFPRLIENEIKGMSSMTEHPSDMNTSLNYDSNYHISLSPMSPNEDGLSPSNKHPKGLFQYTGAYSRGRTLFKAALNADIDIIAGYIVHYIESLHKVIVTEKRIYYTFFIQPYLRMAHACICQYAGMTNYQQLSNNTPNNIETRSTVDLELSVDGLSTVKSKSYSDTNDKYNGPILIDKSINTSHFMNENLAYVNNEQLVRSQIDSDTNDKYNGPILIDKSINTSHFMNENSAYASNEQLLIKQLEAVKIEKEKVNNELIDMKVKHMNNCEKCNERYNSEQLLIKQLEAVKIEKEKVNNELIDMKVKHMNNCEKCNERYNSEQLLIKQLEAVNINTAMFINKLLLHIDKIESQLSTRISMEKLKKSFNTESSLDDNSCSSESYKFMYKEFKSIFNTMYSNKHQIHPVLSNFSTCRSNNSCSEGINDSDYHKLSNSLISAKIKKYNRKTIKLKNEIQRLHQKVRDAELKHVESIKATELKYKEDSENLKDNLDKLCNSIKLIKANHRYEIDNLTSKHEKIINELVVEMETCNQDNEQLALKLSTSEKILAEVKEKHKELHTLNQLLYAEFKELYQKDYQFYSALHNDIHAALSTKSSQIHKLIEHSKTIPIISITESVNVSTLKKLISNYNVYMDCNKDIVKEYLIVSKEQASAVPSMNINDQIEILRDHYDKSILQLYSEINSMKRSEKTNNFSLGSEVQSSDKPFDQSLNQRPLPVVLNGKVTSSMISDVGIEIPEKIPLSNPFLLHKLRNRRNSTSTIKSDSLFQSSQDLSDKSVSIKEFEIPATFNTHPDMFKDQSNKNIKMKNIKFVEVDKPFEKHYPGPNYRYTTNNE